MDPQRFDTLTKTLSTTGTRRSILGLISALGLTGLIREDATAACAVNGTRCGRADDLACCSGFCKRKRNSRKKFCTAAPDQGICTIESNDGCLAGTAPTICSDVDSRLLCSCLVTSRGRSFCASAIECFACKTDTDCEKRLDGRAGDRCVQCTACNESDNKRACARKCLNPATA